MKITLVRHGMTEANYLDICQGGNNELNETGIRQCLKLKEKIKDQNFDFCYMSPLIRAVQTAMLLIGDRVETFPDKRITERKLGEFENQPRKFYDADKYWDYNLNCSDKGVEPIKHLFDRCNDFLEYVKNKNKGQHILVVSHGSPIRALRHLLLNHKLEDNLMDDYIDNLYCETFEIEDK